MTLFTYDDDNRMTSIESADGHLRAFAYNGNGQLAADTIGGYSTSFTYDSAGRPSQIAVANGSTFELAYNNEGQLTQVTKDSAPAYAFSYDSGKALTSFTDGSSALGGTNTITYTPDAAGYGWTRVLPMNRTLVQAVNDIHTVTESTLDGNSVAYTLAQGVRPASANRPGSVPDSEWTYNAHKEITEIDHDSCGVALTRSASTGYVQTRNLVLGAATLTDTFTHNDAGWILTEIRSGREAAYAYRTDGARTAYVVDSNTAEYVVTDGGRVDAVHNAQLGGKLRAPYEGSAVWLVGSNHWPSVEAAITNIAGARGAGAFTAPALVLIEDPVYAADIVISTNLGDLHPSSNFPLIVRSPRDTPVRLTGQATLSGIPNVRFQGFTFENTSASGLVFSNAPGAQLASCIVLGGTLVTNCPGARIIGNTFDYSTGGNALLIADSSNVLVRNNIILNDGTAAGYAASGSAPDSGFNSFWPSNSLVPAEAGSVYGDPLLSAQRCIASYSSPIRSAGVPVAGFGADLRGWVRHASAPSMGAVEYEIETTACDAAGRVTLRTVAGRNYRYTYDARGQLAAYTNEQNQAENATYSYDHLGRRIGMTIGDPGNEGMSYRFVYDGSDVVAEYVDTDNDGTADRRRIYWVLPDLDQRIGFADIDSNNEATFYYYLCDQVGSVLQVVREDGAVVNQYDYDAFGNIRWDSVLTFENFENRYTFQGREWDAHRGDYYFRMRTYVPEWGSFTGPDMNLANGVEGEPEGMGNYLFCLNDPINKTDPLGLMEYSSNEGIWENSVPTPWAHAETMSEIPQELAHNACSTFAWLVENGFSAPTRGTLALGGRGLNALMEGTKRGADEILGTGSGDAIELMCMAPYTMARIPSLFELRAGLRLTSAKATTVARTYAIGEVMPGGQLAGIGPGAALRDGPEFIKLTADDIASLDAQLNEAARKGLAFQQKITSASVSKTPPIAFPGTRMVRLSDLEPMPGGREFADMAKVARIAPFNWAKYEPIVVYERNGMLYILDGWSRKTLAEMQGITHLPAVVRSAGQ